MDARTMQKQFETRVSLIDPTLLIKEKVTSDTIFLFLNEFTKRFVKQIYLQKDNIDDDTQAHKMYIDSIKSLITRIQLFEQPDIRNTDPCCKQYVLPENYFLYIRSNSLVKTTYNDQDNTVLKVIPNDIIATEDVDKVLTTTYNLIILRSPQVSTISNNGKECINVIHDKFTKIDSIDLVYYRLPKEFNVVNVDEVNVLSRCELPESVHNDIVNGAVEMFIVETKHRLTIQNKD